MLLEEETLPNTLWAKKLIMLLGFTYNKTNAYFNDFMLYWKIRAITIFAACVAHPGGKCGEYRHV